ncbi:thioredoxin family protein [uncultured Amnibacterium sp.]|uniref:thioredoxin family protein n=1 Tax=uncultured Amnibacterium sp. TaxID=1631851 RepID=UPI0035CC40A5
MAAPDAAAVVAEVTVTLYSASFCGACARTRRVLEDVIGLVGDRVALREVNVATGPEEAERRGVVATPTTLLTDRAGAELARAAGIPSPDQVLALLDRHLH